MQLMRLTDAADMVTTSSLTNLSTVNAERLCTNRSLSADNNDSRTSVDCRPDDDQVWVNGNAELKELFKNVVLGVVLVAVCLLTIAGNALVLHAVRTERKLQTVGRRPMLSNLFNASTFNDRSYGCTLHYIRKLFGKYAV